MKTDTDLAHMCRQAYQEVDCTVYHLQFIVRSTELANYIGIRGTDFENRWFEGNYWDLIRNARFTPWRSRATGWVHKGYLNGAQHLYEHLRSHCHADLFDKPIIIAGHSMGAAVGALLAQMLEFDDHLVARLVMFGSPRVYWSKPQFHCAVTHYRNGSDIITSVHPFYKLPAPVTQLGSTRNAFNIFDHSIRHYVAALKALEHVEAPPA